MSPHLKAWLAAACADADERGLPELRPLLESLARSTAALRAAEAQLDDRAAALSPADERANTSGPTS